MPFRMWLGACATMRMAGYFRRYYARRRRLEAAADFGAKYDVRRGARLRPPFGEPPRDDSTQFISCFIAPRRQGALAMPHRNAAIAARLSARPATAKMLFGIYFRHATARFGEFSAFRQSGRRYRIHKIRFTWPDGSRRPLFRRRRAIRDASRAISPRTMIQWVY